uniref:Arginyl-tRNA--protein transferase 1 n=1 Tax=Globodera rostochiensis TaxID=31243 RepID=A0A914H674_GLORO
MARQQLNIRRRSHVSYVGISEHGQCGYCKFTKRAQAKATFDDVAPVAADSNSTRLVDDSDAGGSSSNSSTTASTTTTNAASAHMLSSSLAASSSTATTTICSAVPTPTRTSATEDEQQQQRGASGDGDGASTDENDAGDSAVFGLWAHRLTVQHYQCLADRGWRRSGGYLYKPLMDRTCCPQYTIRLDVHKFCLSRTQKRVLRTMRDFLRTGQRPSRRVSDETAPVRPLGGQQQRKRKRTSTTTETAQSAARHTNDDRTSKNSEANDKIVGMDRQPKKKELRRRRAEERLKARGVDLEEYKRQRAARETARRRTIQSFLDGYNRPDWAHTFELRLIGEPSDELEGDFEEEFELFRRYQTQIHREREQGVTPEAFRRFLAASPLMSAVGERDNNNDSEEEEADDEGLPPRRLPGLGSYHQQYRLDGRLIAVAVIDLLPNCLSAKYFFYEPEYAFLSLGTYSALREIAFTQRLARRQSDLHFYYMGFYLYDCPKMRYKGRFRPSELLCDHCFNWLPVSECDRIIEANGGRFSTFHASGEPARVLLNDAQLGQIRCLVGEPAQPITFGQLRHSLASSSARQQQQQDTGAAVSSSAMLLLEELTDKVRTFAYYAGPAALEMALFL